MIAVTFALPAESSDFIRLLKKTVVDGRKGVASIRGEINDRPIAVLHTGVGEKSCRRHIEAFLNEQQFEYLISAGFAGALDDRLRIGSLLISQNFSSPDLFHSLDPDLLGNSVLLGKLATSRQMIDSKSDRDELAEQTGAAAVDMETEFIATACADRRLPMISLRAITDTASEPFPAPPAVLFNVAKQRTDFARLAFYLARNPGALGRLNTFRRRVAMARHSLTTALAKLIRADLI